MRWSKRFTIMVPWSDAARTKAILRGGFRMRLPPAVTSFRASTASVGKTCSASPAPGRLLQRRAHPREHLVPVAGGTLAEQAQRRIPRAVLALAEPSPVRPEAQHHPAGPAERAGNMRDGGGDREDEIEMGDGRGGLGKVGEMKRKVGDAARRQAREIAGAVAHLQ